MLIKFESNNAASFVMQSAIADQLLSMIGHRGATKGSISGSALTDAIAMLEKSLRQKSATESVAQDEDEDEEQEYVSIGARSAPLKEMLQKAGMAEDGFVMWRPE